MVTQTETVRGCAGRGRTALLVGVAVLSMTLAGCLNGTNPPSSSMRPAGGAGYPVTLTHHLGTAVIPARPQRIVALSDGDLDALLMLGIQPVGVATSSGPDGITPWAARMLTGKPAVLRVGDGGVNPDEVLGLNPDLVLAGAAASISTLYARLAPMVPTTAYVGAEDGDPWQVTVRQVAQAVGLPAQGEVVISEVQAKLDAARAAHPELVGKRFVLGQMWHAGGLGVLRSPTDPTVGLLTGLGMKLTPSVVSKAGVTTPRPVPLDSLGLLTRTDVLAVYYADPSLRTLLQDQPAFDRLDVVERGGYVALSRDQYAALRSVTPLSIGYAVDHVIPELARAAAGKG